jgi:hypothetical protein
MTPIIIYIENCRGYLQGNAFAYQDIDIYGSSVAEISFGTRLRAQNIYHSLKTLTQDEMLWTDDYAAVRLVNLHLKIFITIN